MSWPPGICCCQFKDNARKDIFLGYIPHSDQLIFWYDCETERVKIASHCKFDEGFNDMPIESVPTDFQQLVCINQNERLSEDNTEIDTKNLDYFVSLFFFKKETIKVPVITNNYDK